MLAVNSCLDLHFNASIIDLFSICLVSVQNLKCKLLKRCLFLRQMVVGGGGFDSCSPWRGQLKSPREKFAWGTGRLTETVDTFLNFLLKSDIK